MIKGGEKMRSSEESGKLPSKLKKNKALTIAVIIVLAVVFVFLFAALSQESSKRSEIYKDASGAAGLNATISYDCQEDCDQKYDFNVYILNDDGRQVSVVRPDGDGQVKLALPEGDYVMLVGKKFGQSNIFPQEPLKLKNSKELELKLQYK